MYTRCSCYTQGALYRLIITVIQHFKIFLILTIISIYTIAFSPDATQNHPALVRNNNWNSTIKIQHTKLVQNFSAMKLLSAGDLTSDTKNQSFVMFYFWAHSLEAACWSFICQQSSVTCSKALHSVCQGHLLRLAPHMVSLHAVLFFIVIGKMWNHFKLTTWQEFK